jgi:DNA adenine methylase
MTAVAARSTRSHPVTLNEPPGPLLKWAGGKRWQVPALRPLWAKHQHRRLVEPFCGGLAVALGLQPDKALLSDANPHLINFFRWVKAGLRIKLEMRNDSKTYYRYRSRFNELLAQGQHDEEESAALFYYLNRTGYNGLCRFNRSGFYNVPFGSHTKISYRATFPDHQEIFRPWTFQHGDFQALELRREDFVYADPPYDVDFTQYAKGGFSWEDQERTACWLARHRGPVVLVNQATPRILKCYEKLGFALRLLDAPRRISCTGDRTAAREVLATRNV